MTALTPEQEAMKAAYIRARGYWKPWTEGLLRLSPNFLNAYARYAGHPAAHGPLSPVMCELMVITRSVLSSVTSACRLPSAINSPLGSNCSKKARPSSNANWCVLSESLAIGKSNWGSFFTVSRINGGQRYGFLLALSSGYDYGYAVFRMNSGLMSSRS